MVFLRRNIGILAIILLSFWAIKPLIVNGFFPMHDDTQVARVFEMGKALKDGMFPVRWVPDLGYGYGYPIFNFYAPLAYYIGGFFNIIGFDALVATKIMMVLGVVLSGIFMYLLAREFWGEMGGILSGLFYVYAPYHALDIYVRGDVAEFWGYAFVPLMFFGFYKLFQSLKSEGLEVDNSKFKIQNSKLQFKIQKFGIIGALGYAGIILSHNLTALMITPFLLASFLILIIYSKKETRIIITLYLILYTLLGLMISAFYWIPALLEIRYTNVFSQIGGGADFRDHFVCLSQLWESNWGFGGSIPGCIDGLSFRIGKLHIFAIFIGLLAVITYRFRHSGKEVPDGTSASRIPTDLRDSGLTSFARMTTLILLSILGFAISVLMMLEISKPIWEVIPAMAFFQYPWRFLLLASFFSSLVSGATIWFMTIHLRGAYSVSTPVKQASSFVRSSEVAGGTPPRWIMMGCFIVLIVLLISFNSKLFQPQTIISKTAEDYTNEKALKWVASKTSDEFLPPNFKKPKSEKEIARRPPIHPQETLVQKISNIISFGGIVILCLGIFVKDRKRLTT